MGGRRRSSMRVLVMSLVLCVSLHLPWLTSSFPLNSLGQDELSILPSSDSAVFAVASSSHRMSEQSSPLLKPEAEADDSSRVKRAHQAYIRYLRQRKMRQADERELRQKLASKIVPPAATTQGSLLSRLPLPRMPPINTTALMTRIPPKVITTLNETAMNVMQSIPPQLMGAIVAARQNIPAYIAQIRGPVNQAVTNATMMGQRMIRAFREGYRSVKSSDMMATVAGMMGMGGPPPPKTASKPKPPGAASRPGGMMDAIPEPVMRLVANARQMAGGLMSMVMAEPQPGTEPNRIAMAAQQLMQAIQSNPNLRNIMAKVMRMPEPEQKGKKS